MEGLNNNRYMEKDQIEEARYESISSFMDKVERVKKEAARLRKVFADIDPQKKKLVYATIDDVAFMTITMQDLRDMIIREGTTVTYKNGENQYGTKQNPDAQLYLQMSQKQTAAMKILVDCLPKTQAKQIEEGDGFDEFAERDD